MSNKDIGKHASKGGKEVLRRRGTKYMSRIGKAGRKKQLQAKYEMETNK